MDNTDLRGDNRLSVYGTRDRFTRTTERRWWRGDLGI